MENASDAIIMAGAMLIFVIALTVAMTVFSQARVTIDTVVYASDETNYYEYFETDNNIKNRIVGLETIVPTLYKYYKENYTVVFLDEDGDGLELYKTQTNPLLWTGNTYKSNGNLEKRAPIVSKYPGMNENDIRICSFDVDEERSRREPWTGKQENQKKNIDAFLQGTKFPYPNGSGEYDYTGNGFLEKYASSKFIETIGEYSTKYSKSDELSEAQMLNQGVRDNKNKRVIIYQLINN